MDGAQRLGEGLALEHGDTRSRSGAGDHTGQRGAFHHDQAENDNWRQGHEDRIDLEFRREYLLKRLDAACVKGSVCAAGAECMFLHYNTIKKRFFKIQELLQTDLNNTSEKLIIELIIRLRDIDSI